MVQSLLLGGDLSKVSTANLALASNPAGFFKLYPTAHLTSPYPSIKPHNPWIGEFYVVKGRRSTDFVAPKL